MTKELVAGNFRHEYRPLDLGSQQIRLLRVRRAADSVVSCETTVFDLHEAPEYSALSYMWGAPAPTNEILVDAALFGVRANLFRFLEAFAEEQSEYLWIDQICINQSDDLERNHQVGLMSRIYGQCASVIVWLSDPEGSYAEDARDYNETGNFESLVPILRSKYWKRLWIVQEILLGPQVRVLTDGCVWVRWEAMCHSVQNLSTIYLKMRNIVPSAKLLLARSHDYNTLSPDIGWCVLNFSGNDCEEPRDKVYGLLGLVDEKKQMLVDYRKPIYSVYLDAVTSVRPEHYVEVAVCLGNNMNIPKNDIDSLRHFLAFLLPLQVCLSVESSAEPSDLPKMVSYAVGLHPNWRNPYGFGIEEWGIYSQSPEHLANNTELSADEPSHRSTFPAIGDYMSDGGIVRSRKPVRRVKYWNSQEYGQSPRALSSIECLAIWSRTLLRSRKLGWRRNHKQIAEQAKLDVSQTTSKPDYSRDQSRHETDGSILEPRLYRLERDHDYSSSTEYMTCGFSGGKLSTRIRIVHVAWKDNYTGQGYLKTSSGLTSTKDLTLVNISERHTLPLPEGWGLNDWQEFVDVLLRTVSASPRSPEMRVFIWSYNRSDGWLTSATQPCFNSILRLGPQAMKNIYERCRGWLL